MRRFVPLVVLLFLSLPFGIAINGCGSSSTSNRIFCDNVSGLVIGEISTITLQPQIFGFSLNAGQISNPIGPAAATDCRGTNVSATFLYQVRKQDFDTGLIDIDPATRRLCAGRWNRNSGAGVPDYTVCNPTGQFGTAFATASASPATSNAVPIFVHPVATSITIGPPSTNCATDLATNCCPFSTVGTPLPPTGNYTGNSCLSQNVTGQVAARVFANGGTDIANNITCTRSGTDSAGNPTYSPFIGHIAFAPQDAATNIVTIDENGIATAQNPGTTLISASISNASSSAGSFSTCPPASIRLAVPNQGSSTSITVNQNNTQPITATVLDTNGVTLTGVPLEFVSTTPRTLPSGGSSSITPIFPGAGSITAICLPPSCNSAPLNQVGLFGTGLPITSNAINVTTPGTSSSVLFAASTQAQYVASIDFTTGVLNAPVRLPYVPNSMVLSTDGNTLYFGSSTELMTFNTTSSQISEDRSVPGRVLAVSPDGGIVVIADPTRQTISLVSAGGSASTARVTSVYGGIGSAAQFSADSSTVYIAAGNQIIVHSNYTGWTAIPNIPAVDVAVAVPNVGAFFAGPVTTARSYCALTTVSSNNGQPATTNQFFPDARIAGPPADHVAATNDGVHLLSVTSTTVPTITDLAVSVENGNTGIGAACPATGLTFTATPLATGLPVPGVNATAVTSLIPSTDSAFAFLTYTGTGGHLPFYATGSATAPGTVGSVALTGSATAPVGGVFSSDNQTFFAGTTGDNLIHRIARDGNTFTDSAAATIDPRLLDNNGNSVPADLLAQRPRRIN